MSGEHIEGHVQIAAALQGSDLIEELLYLRSSGQESPGNW